MLVGRVPSRGAVLAFPSECEISGLMPVIRCDVTKSLEIRWGLAVGLSGFACSQQVAPTGWTKMSAQEEPLEGGVRLIAHPYPYRTRVEFRVRDSGAS